MTLATHAIVGGTVAALFPSHPITAFLAGFFSHYLLDAIPHWDYEILSEYANPKKTGKRVAADKLFALDLVRTGGDALFGFLLVFIIWYSLVASQWQVLLLGTLGGVLPDFLQFIYTRFPHQPMVILQKLHSSLIHAKHSLNNKPVIGIISQFLIIAIFVVLVKYMLKF